MATFEELRATFLRCEARYYELKAVLADIRGEEYFAKGYRDEAHRLDTEAQELLVAEAQAAVRSI